MALAVAVSIAAVTAATVFGPQTYTRGPGKPRTVKHTFRVANPAPRYILRVVNHGVTSAVVSLNGQDVLEPGDFMAPDRHDRHGRDDRDDRDDRDERKNREKDEDDNKRGRHVLPLIERTVRLRAGENRISVELRGKVGRSLTVDIREVGPADTTPPTITAAASPLANAAGWNNSNVTVSFTCADAGSGIATCPAQTVVNTEGAGQIVSGTAVDRAGLTATASVTLNIDKTAPTIGIALTPPPASNGTYDHAVTAHFTCADSVSGIAACPPDQIVSTDGTHTVTGTAIDAAGNTTTVTSDPFTINLNVTPPTITVSLSPAANANGWHNGPVTAHFTCTPGGAPIATCPPDQVVATDGEGQTVSGTATDQAGRSASVTSDPINIDQVAPVITPYLAAIPGVWHNQPVSGHFVCTDTNGSGIETCPDAQVVSSEGANHTISGTAIDRAGNRATATSESFSIDLSMPEIVVTLSPAANASGWHNTPVTVHFQCTDTGSGVVTCPPDQVVETEGATQAIEGTAVDVAGNQSTASATFSLDLTPPALALDSPSDGAGVFVSPLTAGGTASDALSGISSATCNATAASLSGDTFGCTVALTPGENGLTVTVTDRAGNTSTAARGVTYTRLPVVTITAPANLSYQNITPTTVTGTVDIADATVAINSIATPVVNGQFSMALPLAEGPNVITATATAAGAVGTASLEVTLDTTPPHVTITSPPDQYVTSAASISVAGNVNDIVVGTVNDEQARVTVNGASAQVANRAFLAMDVPLAIGPNVLRAVGTDRVGNAVTTEITVTRQAPAPARIEVLSGNNQTGAVSGVLSAPLVIALTGPMGALANAPVVFKVTQNDGLVTAGGAPAPTVIATTDADGQARVQWTLGARSGAGSNTVEAYSVGIPGTAIFTATGTQGAAARIVVDSGNDQLGAVGQAVPRPLVAVVVDEGHNRLAGVPVTFTVERGGGGFDGQPSVTVISDADGRVAATPTLGLEQGNANNVVHATFPSNPGLPAVFAVSGRVPGNPADTVISGVVLDNSNIPIPGVIVRAVLTNELHASAAVVQSAIVAQTNAQGQFSIAQAPVGLVKLLVDGSTAQPPGTYPVLEYDIVTVAGQDNTVGQPIYLVPLSTTNKLCVTATSGGGTLTMADAPGFSLTFGPGQVTFPGGTKEGCVGVTSVNSDKVPMSPSFGQQPRFVVTIQPAGAIFNPPAPMTIPNVDGLRPREVTEMYSYDHDIVAFVAIGTGVVSDDGMVIRSSPGVGVLKAGWHGAGPTNQTGNVNSPPPPPPPPKPSVSITPNVATIAVGGEVTFTASASPASGGSYAWGLGPTGAGDDPDAATLVTQPACESQSSCVASVTGLKPGTITLRVHFTTAKGGEGHADARITVVEIKHITFKNARMSTFRAIDQTYKTPAVWKGGTLRFSFETVPANAVIPQSQIKWSSRAAGTTREISVTFPIANVDTIVLDVAGVRKAVAVMVSDRPGPPGEEEYAKAHLVDTALAIRHNLVPNPISPWSSGANLEPSLWALAEFPSGTGLNTVRDAARHTYWNCAMAVMISPAYAQGIATGHEYVAPGSPATEQIMDLNNNAVGRALAAALSGAARSLAGCRAAVKGAVLSGAGTLYLDKDYTGTGNTLEDALLLPTNK